MKVLAIPASLRKDSLNRKLLSLAVEIVRKQDVAVEVLDLKEYDMPSYDGDIETSSGVPENGKRLGVKMKESDAIIISSPEYNFSYPGFFKNMIDWVSRLKPNPWSGKPMMLMSASPGMIGGQRSLWQLRQPIESCSGIVHPDMFSLAQAHQAFDANGGLIDAKHSERLKKLVENFLLFARNVSQKQDAAVR